MKISKYGGRQFHNGGRGSSERSTIFRKRYKVGQIIQGVLLKWEQHKLGWVQIEDQKLLANIQTVPAPGDTLTFIVQQLYPDILLKEISPDNLNKQGIYIDPAEVTRKFVTKRSAFQSQARCLFNQFDNMELANSQLRLNAFLELLEENGHIASLFFETQKCVADLNSVLRYAKLFYMPWLVPTALNQEIVLKIKKDTENPDNSFYQLLFALDLPPSIPARFRIMYKKPQCGFKLLTDNANLKTLLGVHFKHSFSEFLNVERIPQQNYGGFLAELLTT
ncbi:hypothetical protein [Maridesulfovibrio zosterae]|uniref:hypothetical protein n=1 Tax=Maridesulfovibrio zosterae TaxID=82171 RepID=UPI0004272E58|nr:hypothetical protein [Maridesulfovibrio zosterae]